jgi:hypothetical protein
MPPRKTKTYGELPSVDKLRTLEAELRVVLGEPNTASHTKVIIVSQLMKIATQIEELVPAPPEVGDPIEALRLRTVG